MTKVITTLMLVILIGLVPSAATSLTHNNSVASSDDDGHDACNVGCTFTSKAETLILGIVSTVTYEPYVRFDNVTIAEADTINAASIGLKPSEGKSGSISAKVYAIKENDTGDFSSDPTSRTLTTAGATWSISAAFIKDTPITSADISGPMQELVNETFWDSGEAMAFKFDYLSGTAARVFYSYDSSEIDKAVPTLGVSYETGGGRDGGDGLPEFSTYTLLLTIILAVLVIPIIGRYSLKKAPVKKAHKRK